MDEKVELWRKAKADKDYVTADALRSELRAAGIDPDAPKGGRSYEDKWARDDRMERWREAKANRDFATADALRVELRAEGYDPDKPGSGRSSEWWAMEDKMRKWKAAKDAKDYTTSDALRAELRTMGMDPDSSGGGKGYMAPVAAVVPMQWGVAPRGASQWGAPNASWGPTPVAKWSSAGSDDSYNAAVEAQLDQWQDARSIKDWATADAIRDSLRAQRVEPSTARPNNMSVQEEHAQWIRAKKAGDYARSDRLRESLRSKGADPEPPRFEKQSRGSGGHSVGGAMANGGYGEDVEEELRQWFDARDQKNWAVADSIRERLRALGIEPAKQERPGPRYSPY